MLLHMNMQGLLNFSVLSCKVWQIFGSVSYVCPCFHFSLWVFKRFCYNIFRCNLKNNSVTGVQICNFFFHKSEFKIYNSKIVISILLLCYMYCFWCSDATLNNGLKFPQYQFYVLNLTVGTFVIYCYFKIKCQLQLRCCFLY